MTEKKERFEILLEEIRGDVKLVLENDSILDNKVDAVKEALLDMAELLTVEAGYAATFKDAVYSALLHHVRAKFLKGSSLGLAERSVVDFAWKMLRQVRAKVAAIPGLIAGVIEHGD